MAGEMLTGVPARSRAVAWLRAGRGGLFVLALAIGAGSGLGAAAFRYLISFFTWLATGHSQFGQQGRVPSGHLPWLGLGVPRADPRDRRAHLRAADLPVRP
jgi:hypothetical protein